MFFRDLDDNVADAGRAIAWHPEPTPPKGPVQKGAGGEATYPVAAVVVSSPANPALLVRGMVVITLLLLVGSGCVMHATSAGIVNEQELLGRWKVEWWTAFGGQNLRGPSATTEAIRDGTIIQIHHLRAVVRQDGSITWQHRTECSLRRYEWKPVDVRISTGGREIRVDFDDYVEDGTSCSRAVYKELYTHE
jgi:hypothetical protein